MPVVTLPRSSQTSSKPHAAFSRSLGTPAQRTQPQVLLWCVCEYDTGILSLLRNGRVHLGHRQVQCGAAVPVSQPRRGTAREQSPHRGRVAPLGRVVEGGAAARGEGVDPCPPHQEQPHHGLMAVDGGLGEGGRRKISVGVKDYEQKAHTRYV